MTFSPLVFAFEEILTSTKLNQLDENIDEVRRNHKGSSAPAALAAGLTYLDDGTSPWTWYLHDGADLIQIGTFNPTTNVFTVSYAANSIPAAAYGTETVPETAMQDGAASARVIGTKAVGAAKIEGDGVDQSFMDTAVGTASGTLNASDGVSIAMNPYCFWPMIHTSNAADVHVSGHGVDADDADAPRFGLRNNGVSSHTYDVDWRYIQASPPYDLGDGDVAGFIYARVDESGVPTAIWAAPDPPWAGLRRLGANEPTAADVAEGRCSLEELIAIRRESQLGRMDLPGKLEGMSRCPHPFGASDHVVMIDPMEGLAELLLDDCRGARDIRKLRPRIVIDSERLRRSGPPGIPVHKARLR